MASMISLEMKKRILEIIKDVSSPVQIILFGSYVYGSPKPDSDLDIVVIVKKVVSKILESNKIWNALREIQLPKDIIVITQDEYEFYRKEPGSIFRTIAQKGEVLYG